jgi:hypothetical protein
VDQGELPHSAKPAVRLPKEGDDHLPALTPFMKPISAGVPDPHCARTVLTFGNPSVERQVLHRMIFGAHCEVVDPRVGRRSLGHCPAGQNSVVFQSDVVVQPAGMVLLDDESKGVSLLIRRPGRHRLWRLRGISHAPVSGEAVA